MMGGEGEGVMNGLTIGVGGGDLGAEVEVEDVGVEFSAAKELEGGTEFFGEQAEWGAGGGGEVGEIGVEFSRGVEAEADVPVESLGEGGESGEFGEGVNDHAQAGLGEGGEPGMFGGAVDEDVGGVGGKVEGGVEFAGGDDFESAMGVEPGLDGGGEGEGFEGPPEADGQVVEEGVEAVGLGGQGFGGEDEARGGGVAEGATDTGGPEGGGHGDGWHWLGVALGSGADE